MTKLTQYISGKTLLIIALAVASVGLRLVPHIPNAAPVAALAILCGAMFKRPWSYAVPLVVMLASDFIIGFYQWPIMLSVYATMLLTVLLGEWLKDNKNPWRVASTGVASAVLFYLVTNAAVWKFSGMYPQTMDGLMLSYFYGIPFFRFTLFGNIAYTVGFFLAIEYLPEFVRNLNPLTVSKKLAHTQE